MPSRISGSLDRHRSRRVAAAKRVPRALGPALIVLLCVSPALAETAWVRSEVRLNVRTGAGTQFRIVGVVATGDSVDILDSSAENITPEHLRCCIPP